jgi:hypothetical protein
MQSVQPSGSTKTTGTLRPTHSLDSLSCLDTRELESIYRGGNVPSHFRVLDGHPRGRMLAVRKIESSPVGRSLRRFAAARAFPWGGKSFSALTANTGNGINRVHLFGRHQLFPFHTLLGASRIDGEPALILDYDLSDNPGLIRKIHDEIREVAPGLFLGPAMWKTDAGEALVLWFALDTNEQAVAIGNH